jgi:hypothetical protein
MAVAAGDGDGDGERGRERQAASEIRGAGAGGVSDGYRWSLFINGDDRSISQLLPVLYHHLRPRESSC